MVGTSPKKSGLIVGNSERAWRTAWEGLRKGCGYALQKAEGKKWEPDVLRHCYASYTLAVGQISRGQLAEIMGNSETIIRAHYRQSIPQAEAEKFWNLTPETVKREVV